MKPDQIIRTKRKTIAIIIDEDGHLIVRAPYHTRDEEIEELVSSKKKWIQSKQIEIALSNEKIQPKEFVNGEKYLYLGDLYPLIIVPAQRKALELSGNRFRLRKSAVPRGKQTFEAWYRSQARTVLSERVASFAEDMGLRYSKIRITGARTRWGSCGPKGSLNFTWRLIMAPISIVDYVVVHELAHLKFRNHGAEYWKLVESSMPDYQERRKWLRDEGMILTL